MILESTNKLNESIYSIDFNEEKFFCNLTWLYYVINTIDMMCLEL